MASSYFPDLTSEYYRMQALREEERAIRRQKEELARLQSYPIHKKMSYDDIVPFCLSTEELGKKDQPDPLLLLCRT